LPFELALILYHCPFFIAILFDRRIVSIDVN
jgi:hypothetical protein